MKRKVFIKNALPVSLMSSVLLSNLLKGCKPEDSGQVLQQQAENNRVLVLIQLDGGNDGLNTIIPLSQYQNLSEARKNILIPEKKVLTLNNSSGTGLHPAMGELQRMYNDKLVTVIQGVGCPNPDLSHFKAIDIWHTGSDSADNVSTGWLGRFLDNDSQSKSGVGEFDPPAVKVGSSLSKILQGSESMTGMVVRQLNSFYDLSIGHYHPDSATPSDSQLSFLRTTVVDSKKYLLRVKIASEKQKNLSKKYPAFGNNALADQLKTVARLIGGGLQTKVYLVSLGGFDTHDKQVDASDTSKGAHADLLSKLSAAMAAFQDDLFLMGKQNQVMSMVFSEFGRRIKSNSGLGSDHGTAAPVILFGTKVKGGFIGENPEIPSKVNAEDNLPLQTDFRSVYASLLKNWFGTPEPVAKSILLGSYPTLDLFNS